MFHVLMYLKHGGVSLFRTWSLLTLDSGRTIMGHADSHRGKIPINVESRHDSPVSSAHSRSQVPGLVFAPPLSNPSPTREEGLIAADGLAWWGQVCAKTRLLRALWIFQYALIARQAVFRCARTAALRSAPARPDHESILGIFPRCPVRPGRGRWTAARWARYSSCDIHRR